MADKDLKVMIELAADAKGVKAGVESATGQLEKMKSAVSDIRSLAVIGYATQFAQMIAGGIQAEFQHITDAAHNYSAAGMRGQAGLDMATMKSDMKLAEAFGPFIELADQIKAQGIIEVTSYLVANKDAIGQAIVNIATFGVAIADLTAGALVEFSKFINDPVGYVLSIGEDKPKEYVSPWTPEQLAGPPVSAQQLMDMYRLIDDRTKT